MLPNKLSDKDFEFVARNIINLTPHPISLASPKNPNEKLVLFPDSRGALNALPCMYTREEFRRLFWSERLNNLVTLGSTKFKPLPQGIGLINEIKHNNPDAIIVGSYIASKAYPGLVVSLVSLPGYERVRADIKKTNPFLYNIYTEFDQGPSYDNDELIIV